MVELGWKSMGNLELSALPILDRDAWVPLVEQTDVLLVNGGDPMFLCYWMRESGLAELLPSLTNNGLRGVSAGSMVMTPRIGEDFVNWKPPTGGDETLGLVDFSIFPTWTTRTCPRTRWPLRSSGRPVLAILLT